MAAIGGTENCPAQRHDSVHSLPIENDVIARRQQAFKSIAKTNHFPAELVRCQHYGAQNRIKPGQSPPLVRTPMRGFIFAEAKLEDFFWISHPPRSRPLMVQLPAALHQSCAFSESVSAAQEHHH